MESVSRRIRVCLLSNVRFYREGLGRVLASFDQIALLGTAASTDEGLCLVERLRPDVVLLDTATEDGVWRAQQIADAMPGTKIVALAVPRAEEELILLVEAGVLGYVAPEQSLDELVAAISSVVDDELASSPRLHTLVVKRLRALAAELGPPVDARLTAREREILELVARGLSNKAIAAELGIEPSTVKNHIHNILEKLQVQTRMAAVAEMRRGSTPGSVPDLTAVPALR